jgi:hypothetical protein
MTQHMLASARTHNEAERAFLERAREAVLAPAVTDSRSP